MRKLMGRLAVVALLPLPALADLTTPIVAVDVATGFWTSTGPSCPGQVLVGGGFDTEFPATLQNDSSEALAGGTSSWRAGMFNPGPDERSTMLLAPAWPFDPAGSRLRERADGETSAPTAWEAVVRNDSQSSSLREPRPRSAPRRATS